MFKGTLVALVTPFRDGAVDFVAFKAVVQRCLDAGVHGLVPGGTTGESPTITAAEQLEMVKVCVQMAAGRVPVVAGAGGNNTAAVVDKAQAMREAGADAILSVTPYYNKPSQEGLYQHFKTVAAAAGLPVVLYNIPGRAAVRIDIDTLVRLSKIDNIVAVKDATGDVAGASEVVERCGAGLALLAGDDALVLPMLAVGGAGVISASANVDPARFVTVCNAFFAGDLEASRRAQHELGPVIRALFSEPNPAPTKAALEMILAGFPGELRLPLLPMSATGREKLRGVLHSAGLL